MPTQEGSFGIDRDGAINHRFNFVSLRDIPVGNEGEKVIAEIASRRGSHGRYILKTMMHAKEAHWQRIKYLHLKKHHVNVPDVFKPIALRGGTNAVIISDLTQNDKYWVLSMNNPEVNQDFYKEIALQIPPSTREKIKHDLIHACEVGAGILSSDEPVYRFQNNAFMLAINPKDPSDAKVFVADFGVDIMESTRNKQDVLDENLSNAVVFYSWMIGERFRMPPESPYAYLNNESQIQEEIMQYRQWAKHHMKKIMEESEN